MSVSKFIGHQNIINTGLFFIGCGLAVAYGMGLWPITDWPEAMFFKGICIFMLFMMALTRGTDKGFDGGTKFLLMLALLSGTAGDALLEAPWEDAFLMGLGAFLVGHVFYIMLVLNNKDAKAPPANKLLVGLVWIAVIANFIIMFMQQAEITLPIIAYSLILATMASTAILSRFNLFYVGIGAILFMVSDMILGLAMFIDIPSWMGNVVWATYFPAQALLTLGICRGAK